MKIFFCIHKTPEICYQSIKKKMNFQHDIEFMIEKISQLCVEMTH